MQRRPLLAILLCATFASPLALAQEVIRLSTTTSTENSGLLKHLLPVFEAKTNTRVDVISVGTGKALELAKNGDVDVTLVHARAMEDKFVDEGWGVDRRDVMYNDFIAVNPAKHPGVNHKGAQQLIAWITSPEGQARIASFRPAGEQLFFAPLR